MDGAFRRTGLTWGSQRRSGYGAGDGAAGRGPRRKAGTAAVMALARFTFSGDYYHDAYWSVDQQGTFVSPATLPASTATAPLQTAPANNSAAR
jgi:hypothetical protein